MESVYIIWTCDKWKSWESARLYAVCKKPDVAFQLIKGGIEEGTFTLQDSFTLDNLKNDLECGNTDLCIDYGFVTCEDVQDFV